MTPKQRAWYQKYVLDAPKNPHPEYLDPNPAAASRNRHHEGYYRDEADWLDATTPLPGRPEDTTGYPGEDNCNYQQINRVPKEYDDTNG